VTITADIDTQVVIVFAQDATGGRTVTGWDSSIRWAGGTPPTITATANAIDVVALMHHQGLWLANVSQDYL
jgi:hypothetical protein